MKGICKKSVEALSSGSPPIFSQSWGVKCDGTTDKRGYDEHTREFDCTLREKNTLVCRSAGNDGDKPSKQRICGSYACGKNVLTVGACESSTSVWTEAYADVPSNATKAPQPKGIPGDPCEMYVSSSYGTDERRLKPDVVAPGVMILSARSRDIEPEVVASDHNYCFKTGRSMATPLVAGCAAVLNQALRATDQIYKGYSGMLLKALLVNGAVSLDPANPQYISGNERPWGFGRVNMLGSLKHLANETRPATYKYGRLKENEKGSWDFTIPAPTGTPGSLTSDTFPSSVKVTLSYAEGAFGIHLICLVYLTLTEVKTGNVRFGNREKWYDPKTAATKVEQCADFANNVQQIYCTRLEEGDYKIAIHFLKTRFDPASEVPFGVAWLVF